MKPLRLLSLFILLAGGCLTARALYLRAKAELAGILIRHAWEQTLATGAPHRPWPWADTHPIARLQIPRLGYDEIVLEGASPRTLAFGPARMSYSARLGEPGNLVLAGHRTSWFRRLEAIAPADEIKVDWYASHEKHPRQRIFKVSAIRIVDPSNTALLAPTDDDVLTLITCYPFGHSPHSPQRFIVRAEPVMDHRPVLAEVLN